MRLRAQLATLRDLPPLPGDESASASPGPVDAAGYAATPAVAGLLKLLDGGAITKKPDHAARLAQIEEIRAAAWQAGADQQEHCDQTAGMVIHEYAQKLKPAHDALSVEMYRAAQELSRRRAAS